MLALFGVAPLLVAEDADGAVAVAVLRPLERGEAADDGRVVAVGAVAPQFDEAVGERLDVVERVGPQRVPGDLHALPAGEAPIDGLPQLLDASFQGLDFRPEVGLGLLVDGPHLVEPLLQLYEGFLEVEQVFLRIGHIDNIPGGRVGSEGGSSVLRQMAHSADEDTPI